MSADAEQFIRYFVSSPWIVVLLSLAGWLIGVLIRSSIRKRRARARAQRHRRYWREKFESELPQILNRNRQLQEALPAPAPVPLLDFDPNGGNTAFVLSSEVIGSRQLENQEELDFTQEYDLHDPATDYRMSDLSGHWAPAR